MANVGNMSSITRFVKKFKKRKYRKSPKPIKTDAMDLSFDFDFLLLLKNDATQRDFREYLDVTGRPEMTAYVDFAARCFALQEMKTNEEENKSLRNSTGSLNGSVCADSDVSLADDKIKIRIVAAIVDIYNTYIRPYSYDKIDFEDFGKTQEKIEFDIRNYNLEPIIFRQAIWIVSRKLSEPLRLFTEL